jgi:hypothetical protein
MRDSNAVLVIALYAWLAIPLLCLFNRRRSRRFPRVLGAGAALLVIAASGVLAAHYPEFQDAVGTRYVAGYHLHHRVDTADDDSPIQVTTVTTDHWYATAAMWLLMMVSGLLLLAAPLVTMATVFKSRR